MNQRSNQPDGEPPPQKAKKKAKKSDDAPTEAPLAPISDDPADYRLCAVELRACARQVRAWKARQIGFLEGGLRTLLAVQDVAVVRIGIPPAVTMERLEDRLWCWTVFLTPTTSTTFRVPYGPKMDLAVEPPSDQFQRLIEESSAAFTAEQRKFLRQIVDALRARYEAGPPPEASPWVAEGQFVPPPRGFPKAAPPTSTDKLQIAKERAEVPATAPPTKIEVALEAMRAVIFRDEYEAGEMIAGAFETLAECVEFLADYKPPELSAKEQETLVRMLAAGARGERSAIAIKASAAAWDGPLGKTTGTRQRNASLAVGSLKRARLAAPEGHSERSYLTAKGIRVASTIRAARAHR